MINKSTPCYRFADLPELLPRGDVLNLTEFSDAVGIAARAILGPGRRQRGEDNNDDFEAIHVGAWNCTKTEQWKSWADAFIWTVVRRRAKEGRSINRMGKAIDHPWNRLDKTSLKIGILRIAASQITKFLQVFLQLKICYFFKKSGLFFVYFRLFKQTTIKCEKCPSSLRRRDSNSQPSDYVSPPLTTRPGLLP